MLGMAVSYGQPASAGSPNDKLFSRIYGCEAAATIANAMRASVEGWTYERIEQTYGFLNRFLPKEQQESVRPVRFGLKFEYHAYRREAGWGEDGMERYRLLTSAILKKGGRVNIADVTREWIESMNPARFGYNVGPQDQVIYYLLEASLPPWEVGRWALWPGFMGTSKMIMPVGMVNAGRPDNAGRDALDITRFKDVQGRPVWRDDTRTISKVSSVVYNYGLENAAAIAAATAQALRPKATVSSIVKPALAQLPTGAREEVETGIGWVRKAKNWKEVAPQYGKFYKGQPSSLAVEVLSSSLACLVVTEGRPRDALICSANLGRDASSKAHLAGGWAGALRGVQAVPVEWVEAVEKEVVNDPYTVSRRTARQAAEGICRTCLNETRRTKTTNAGIASLMGK